MRISPNVHIALGLRIKQPVDTMKREDVELMPTEQERAFKPPYQRLLSDAIRGIGDLFGRHDIVDARIVERVLDDSAPSDIYEPGNRGPEEANRLIEPDGPWHNPLPTEPDP